MGEIASEILYFTKVTALDACLDRTMKCTKYIIFKADLAAFWEVDESIGIEDSIREELR